MNHVDRNYKIIEEKMLAQMKESLEYGKTLIDTELDAGIFNFIVKPVVKTFYKYWSDHDCKEGTIQQIKVTLDCAKLLLNNGIVDEKFEKLVNEHFPKYLEGDQTYRQCRKTHKNFKKLEEITKEAFISQVQDAITLLKVDEDIETYDDLCLTVYKTRENAYKSLKRQLDFNERGIEVVEKDPSILKMPTGKNVLIRALRKGFEQTKSDLIGNLNKVFID